MTLEMQPAGLGRTDAVANDKSRLGGWRTVLFATPAFPLSAMLLPFLIYLPDYYARELGLDLAIMAGVLFIARIADMVFDPIMGLAIDRSRPRMGRYRAWFLGGVPVAVIAVFMLYNAPVGVGGAYLLLWLVLANLGQSASYLSHISWAAAAAKSYDQRSNVFGWLMVFGVLGMFVIMALPPVASLVFGWDRSESVGSMGWLMIAALPIAALITVAAVGEPAPKPMIVRPNMREMLGLARHGNVMRLLIVDTMWAIGPAVAGTLMFAYFDSLKHIDRDVAGLALLSYFVGGMIGAPLWIRISKLRNKHSALFWSGMTYAVVQSAIMLAPPGDVTLMLIMMGIAGLPSNAGPILIRSMMADVADEVRLKSGVDRLSLLMALLSSISKIGTAAMTALAFYILSVVDFDIKVGRDNAQTGLWTLAILFAVLPALSGLLTALAIWGYRLDSKAHADIREKLDEMDARAKSGELVEKT